MTPSSVMPPCAGPARPGVGAGPTRMAASSPVGEGQRVPPDGTGVRASATLARPNVRNRPRTPAGPTTTRGAAWRSTRQAARPRYSACTLGTVVPHPPAPPLPVLAALAAEKPATILVVDDGPPNVKLLEALLAAEGYLTRAARSGQEALALAQADPPDLILLDAMMPDLDGFQTLARLKADPRTRHVPVMMITALDDRATRLQALEAGAEELLPKPIDRTDLRLRVRNQLRLKAYADLLEHQQALVEAQVSARTAQLEEACHDTLTTLLAVAERDDPGTGPHIRRMARYADVLAEGLDLPAGHRQALRDASPMHDLGKVGVPSAILLKQGPLDPQEWEVVRSHCALGAHLLSSGGTPVTRLGAEIALGHHEHWDGSGYPNGLTGAAIPLAARIVLLCDVYDTLRSLRPYKPPLDHARAVEILARGDERSRPAHFDPAVLACFLARADRFAAILP